MPPGQCSAPLNVSTKVLQTGHEGALRQVPGTPMSPHPNIASGLEVAHEGGQPARLVADEEEVVVVGEDPVVDHANAVAPRGAREGTDQDGIEPRRGPQQEAALEAAVGDLDETAPLRDVA